MSRLVRCLGAAMLVALALLALPGARPALAEPPSVSIDSPVADSVQESAFAITGSIRQEGNEATIVSAKVRLVDDEGWTTPVEHTYNGTAGGIFTGGGADVSFNWSNISPRYNGPYTVTVTATGQYRPALSSPAQQTNVVSKSFHVEIAPAAPTGVTASKPDNSTVATVAWKANPEPDIFGYLVYRSYAGDAGKEIGRVSSDKLSFTDDLAGKAPGSYKYAVQAVRHVRSCKSPSNTDDACTRGKAGKLSSYSQPVTVRSTAPTTTTTTIKKGTGSGTGTGTGGGTGRGATTTTAPGTPPSGTRGAARGSTSGTGFAPGGEVDLSEFSGLLNGRARPTGGGRAGEDPGTYEGTLPYGERSVKEPENDDSLITIGGASVPKPSDDWVKFIGAGALATALLVHVLWFKQQVDRIPLEAID